MAERGFDNAFAGQAGFPTSPEMRKPQSLPPQRQQQAGEHRPNFGGDAYSQPALGIGPQADGQQFRTKQQSIPPGVASFLRTHSLGTGAANIQNRVASLEDMQRRAMEQTAPQGAAVDSLARSMSARPGLGDSRPQDSYQYDYSGGGGQQPIPQDIPIPVPGAGGGGPGAVPGVEGPVNPYAMPPAVDAAGDPSAPDTSGFALAPPPEMPASPYAQMAPEMPASPYAQAGGGFAPGEAPWQQLPAGQTPGGDPQEYAKYGGHDPDSALGKAFKLVSDTAALYDENGAIKKGMEQQVKDQIAQSKDYLQSALSEAGGLLLAGGSPQLAQESLNAAKAMVDMEAKFAAAQVQAYAQAAGILTNLAGLEQAEKWKQKAFDANEKAASNKRLLDMYDVWVGNGYTLDKEGLKTFNKWLAEGYIPTQEEIDELFAEPTEEEAAEKKAAYKKTMVHDGDKLPNGQIATNSFLKWSSNPVKYDYLPSAK